MKLLLIFLFTGAFQCWLGHALNIHDGLEHMQHEHFGWYVFESLFYAGYHALVYGWVTGK